MQDKKWYENMVMINRDPNWYGRINGSSKEDCKTSLSKFFSLYKDSGLTDVAIGVLEQTTIIPSKHLMWRGLKFLQTKENGKEVSYPDSEDLYNCYEKYNVDAIQIFIDRMNDFGIRPWISVRTNDVHFGDVNTPSFLRPDLFYEEYKAGRMIGEEYGYFATAYDFKYPNYREALFGFICEILEKYDIFGFELDFMREIRCFDYLHEPECYKIMTDFVKRVHEKIVEASERVGHEIKLSIRICRDPEDALAFGFDIKTMVDEGYLDLVVVTPRWSAADSDMPIEKWKALLGEDFPILAGIETLCVNSTKSTIFNSKAYAAEYYARGADGIYYNNHENYNMQNCLCWKVNRESCLVGRREFVVGWQDTFAYNDRKYKPLPMSFESTADLPINVGLVKAVDKVSVVINYQGDAAPILKINGTAYEGNVNVNNILATQGIKDVVMTPDTAIAYYISGIYTDGPLNLTFEGSGTITYVTVIIDAK